MSSNSDTLNRTVGRRIAAARRAAGLTQAELAARLDMPRDTLIHYEHGRRAIAVDRLAVIAAGLNILPATLLMDDDTLAHLFTQLSLDPYLPKQVLFFLNTLEASEDEQQKG
jgi:transcriptional regulator with XRE-family HTH domain